ncbi:hypothetical protein ACWFPY_32225 [Nocardia fluminea]
MFDIANRARGCSGNFGELLLGQVVAASLRPNLSADAFQYVHDHTFDRQDIAELALSV